MKKLILLILIFNYYFIFSSEKISVVGTGYVGLVTGVCLANLGHEVICVDVDCDKIKALQKGKTPLFEPGLQELLDKAIQSQNIEFTTNLSKALQKSSMLFISVPTPSLSDGSTNLSYLYELIQDIAERLEGYQVIVLKTTAPVGTCLKVQQFLQQMLEQNGKKVSFDVVANPEFLSQGSAVQDFLKPNRVIIGAENSESGLAVQKIYSSFVPMEKIFLFDSQSAEMVKYASNAMLACRISFINEIARICEKMGVDVKKVKQGMSEDPRIGKSYLNPGLGFGGSCLSKDLKSLLFTAKKEMVSVDLLESILIANEKQKLNASEKIIQLFNQEKGGINNKIISIWGLSFKPNTCDLRDAPSLEIIERLREKGAILKLYDPLALKKVRQLLGESPNIIYCESALEAAKGADAIVLVTEWNEFQKIDFKKVLKNMRGKAFFDGRNCCPSDKLSTIGFNYLGIGTQS